MGELLLHFRQDTGGTSPIGEFPQYFRQQSCWTLATGEFPIGESFIGEIRKPRNIHYWEGPRIIVFCCSRIISGSEQVLSKKKDVCEAWFK
jgi:hypothetical protein